MARKEWRPENEAGENRFLQSCISHCPPTLRLCTDPQIFWDASINSTDPSVPQGDLSTVNSNGYSREFHWFMNNTWKIPFPLRSQIIGHRYLLSFPNIYFKCIIFHNSVGQKFGQIQLGGSVPCDIRWCHSLSCWLGRGGRPTTSVTYLVPLGSFHGLSVGLDWAALEHGGLKVWNFYYGDWLLPDT